ncbi:MAG: AbrB/MazE/SpoVT family DNA-binding domain-containing protein [Rhodospirillaceae bacterium]|nr:AbrB/MazE/SpoVT family DNA-binding domain-containing protein [Rhodospirillaceae bacterium]
MLAKRTSKNQITLPKAAVEMVGSPTYFQATVSRGRIVLTPVQIGLAEAAWKKIRALGISEADVARAVSWARRKRRNAE